MSLTRIDVAQAIDRMAGAFGQPFAATGAEAERMISSWLSVLEHCQPFDLHRATLDLMRTRKRWPAAADVYELCVADERRRRGEQQRQDAHGAEGNGEFCLRCHTHDLITRANGRFMPFHADNCPGLHDVDRLDLRHAIATGASVWRGGRNGGSRPTLTRGPDDA